MGTVVIIMLIALSITILAAQSGASPLAGGSSGGGSAPPPPAFYSAAQIAGLAALAGFSGPDLALAVAVALAESGGNASAYNPESAAGAIEGAGSFGLWQIYRTAHPEFAGQNLFDPNVNASAAYSVYRAAGSRFTPWSTFKNGAYMGFLSQAEQVVSPPDGSPIYGEGITP